MTFNSNKKINPLFYKNPTPKPVFMTKILQLIDKNLDSFKHWGCAFNCVKQPCNCKKINLVCTYLYYKLFS